MKKIMLGFIVGLMVSFSSMAFADSSQIKMLIDGKDVTETMDVKPQIIDGRTMVPIRFVAENLGVQVDWDDTSRTVKITTAADSVNTPGIISAELNKTSISSGDTATLTVSTNAATTSIKVTSGGETIAESTNFTTGSYGNTFTINIPMEDAGTYVLSVYCGNASGYTSTQKTVSLTVTGESSGDLEIQSITLDDSTVDDGDTVNVTVKTSTDVAKVTIEDGDGDVIKSKTSPTSKTTSVYTWELSFTANDDSGKNTYRVYVYDDDDNDEYDDFSFTISSSSTDPEIEDITVENDDDIYDGDPVTITVKTNTDVESVSVFYDDDDEMDSTSSYSTSGSYRYFELDFNIDYQGYYYVYAYDEDEENEVYEKVYIYLQD